MKITGVFLDHFRRQPDGRYLDFMANCRFIGSHDADKNDVVDAICYCLFGDYLNSRRNNSYGTKKNGYYRVRVYVASQGTTYSFYRAAPAKENPLKIAIRDPFSVLVISADGQSREYFGRDAEEIRRRIVGNSKPVFMGSQLVQGKYDDVFLSGPANKEAIFFAAFGPEHYEQAVSALKEANVSVTARRHFLKKKLDDQCQRFLSKAKESLPILPSELMNAKALVFNGTRCLQPIYQYFYLQMTNAKALLEDIRQLRLNGLKKMNLKAAHFQNFWGSSTNRDPLHIGTKSRRVMVYTRYLSVAEELEHVQRQISDLQKMIGLFEEFLGDLSKARKKMRERIHRFAEDIVDAKEIDDFDIRYSQSLLKDDRFLFLKDASATQMAFFFNADPESIVEWPKLEKENDEGFASLNEFLKVDVQNTFLLPKEIKEEVDFYDYFSFNQVEDRVIDSLTQSFSQTNATPRDDYVFCLESSMELLDRITEELEKRIASFQMAKANFVVKYEALMARKDTFLINKLSTRAASIRLSALRKELDEACKSFSEKEKSIQGMNDVGEKEKKLVLRPAVESLEQAFQDILARAEDQAEQAQRDFENAARFMEEAKKIYDAINRIQNALDVCDLNYTTAIEMIQKLTGKTHISNVLRRVKKMSPISVLVRRQAKEVLDKASEIYSDLMEEKYTLFFEEPSESKEESQCFDILISRETEKDTDTEREEPISIDNLPPMNRQLISFALNYALNLVYLHRYGEVFRETVILDQLDEEVTQIQREKMKKYIDRLPETTYIYMPPNKESWFAIARFEFDLK